MQKINRPPCPDPAALLTNYKAPVNKAALVKASNGKCMYCESEVTTVYFGDVEHIRPIDKFPKLKFVWDNHGFACAICNNGKRTNWFENLPFVNPYEEDPGGFISAEGPWLAGKDNKGRGDQTIIIIDLNRKNLILDRCKMVARIEQLAKQYKRERDPALKAALERHMKKEVDLDGEYSLVVKTTCKRLGILSMVS